MTVGEIFAKAKLSHLWGPVQWKDKDNVPDESKPGVYVVARVGKPDESCEPCKLQLIDPRRDGLVIDLEYEHQRWLRSEPVMYIGQTTKSTLHKRIGDFFRHKCGNRSPHAGGQIVHLLKCPLWVYWSPSRNPYDDEPAMLCAFKEQAGQVPFANFNGKYGKKGKRIRC